MDKLKDFSFDRISVRTIQLVCLALIGILEIITMLVGSTIEYPFRQCLFNGICMISMVYFGVSISRPMSRLARNVMLLGIAFCLWPLLLQIYEFRFCMVEGFDGSRFLNTTSVTGYMMMLPFAAIGEEEDRGAGLRVFGACYVAAAAVLSVWAVMLLNDVIPASMTEILKWSEVTRIAVAWNSNVLAPIFLIAIGFSLYFACTARKLWIRVLMLAVTALFFVIVTMTDSRASILMICCLLGGTVFFLILRGEINNGKRVLLGLLAAFIVLGASYKLSGALYNAHYEAMAEKITAMDAELDALEAAGQTVERPTDEGYEITPEYLEESREYRTSGEHFFDFGRRSYIWSGMFAGLAQNPKQILLGVRDFPSLVMPYCGEFIANSHNSWLETMVRLGIVGFLFTLYFAYLALKNTILILFLRKTTVGQKIIAMTTCCLMGTQFFEAFLFYPDYPINFLNLMFMLCLGYLIYWGKTSAPAFEKKTRA